MATHLRGNSLSLSQQLRFALVLGWLYLDENDGAEYVPVEWDAGGRFEQKDLRPLLRRKYIESSPDGTGWRPLPLTHCIITAWRKRQEYNLDKIEEYLKLSKTVANIKLSIRTRILAGKQAEEIYHYMDFRDHCHIYRMARERGQKTHHVFEMPEHPGKRSFE